MKEKIFGTRKLKRYHNFNGGSKSVNNETNNENLEDLKKKSCAPAAKYENGSCFDINSLIKIVEIHNKQNKSNPILFEENAIELIEKDPILYKKTIVENINSRLKDKCNLEKCWIYHPLLNYDNTSRDTMLKIRHASLKPEKPKGKDWLSNFDIWSVLNQYEKVYADFHGFVYNYDNFLKYGYHIPDFKVLEEKGKSRLGIVYNTGAHWIPIFIDLGKGKIYNFDSRASKPEKDIPKLIKKAQKYILTKRIEPDIRINKDIYQEGNDECGMYSILFIIKMLEPNSSYDEYCKWLKEIKGGSEDEGINKLRDYFFIDYEK